MSLDADPALVVVDLPSGPAVGRTVGISHCNAHGEASVLVDVAGVVRPVFRADVHPPTPHHLERCHPEGA